MVAARRFSPITILGSISTEDDENPQSLLAASQRLWVG
jgi:hypothetical protein